MTQDKEEEEEPSVPVEGNAPGASSTMSFDYQGDGNRTGMALMARWENVQLSIGRAGCAVPVDLLLEASRAPRKLIPRICFLFCLKDSNLWIRVAVPSLESGLGGNRETRILENAFEKFDLAQLIIKKNPTHT